MLGLKDAAPVPVQELEISPDNYYILMASDRLESARELEMLQGSFLTTNIVTALEEKSTEADKDKDGRISMQDLYQWLEDRAKIHNQLFPNISVRYPYLLGKQKGEFYLTLDRSAWVPYELDWPDGSTMVILPLRPTNSLTTWLCNLFYRSVSGLPVVCLSKYPITNEQYLRFVMDGGGKEPIGEHYISQLEETTQQVVSEQKSAGSWQGPFYPWRSEEFRDPEKPVVCISYYEARAYCDWVNALNTQAQAYTFLPPAILWDFAAFGKYPIIQPGEEFAMFNLEYPSYNWDTIFTQYQRIHHRATAPTAIDRTGARSNALGISDLLGNVWEWCGDDEPTSPYWDKIRSLVSQGSLYEPTLHLRGGGFLDDLSIERPLRTSNLYGTSARHSDLGFRTAALIPIAHLPQEMQQHLFQRWGYPPDQASRHHRT